MVFLKLKFDQRKVNNEIIVSQHNYSFNYNKYYCITTW